MNIFLKKLTRKFISPAKTVKIGGRTLILETEWSHENDYYRFLRYGELTANIAFDYYPYKSLIKKGDIVLDAGANVGFTALLALEFGAALVHAVEPDPRLYRRLSSLQCGQLKTYPFALSDRDGICKLHVSKFHNQGSTVSSKTVTKFNHIFDGDTISVETRTVDGLFKETKFDFIKIDVEGAEAMVLSGAINLLATNPPRILLVEIYDEFLPETLRILKPLFGPASRLIFDQHVKKIVSFELSSRDKIDGDRYFKDPPTYLFERKKLEI